MCKRILKFISATFGFTTTLARLLFVTTLGTATAIAYTKYRYAVVTHTAPFPIDYIGLAFFALIAFVFGWLGFSSQGKDILTDNDTQLSAQWVRISKVVLAAIGITGGIWLCLIVLSLVLGGPDIMEEMFNGWVIIALFVISFPIAYKLLKAR